MPDKKDAVYWRVSTKDQDERSQAGDLKRFVGDRPEEVMRFGDSFTGRTMDRPGFNSMMGAARAGKLARIIVWRLDRLGRTAAGLTALFEELQLLGVGLVSLKDGVDLSTPAGRLMANVIASVAAYETEVRFERQQAGIAAARERGGVYLGGKAGRVVKVTEERRAAVYKLLDAGGKIASIARTVGLSRQTIYCLIRERM